MQIIMMLSVFKPENLAKRGFCCVNAVDFADGAAQFLSLPGDTLPV